MVQMGWGEPTGQGWLQVSELGVAFVLSAIIGLERELKQKSAGIRTYPLIGFASALFMLVSKYGFTDVLSTGQVVLDPSRVAAQIVTGLGFIGGGIIFVKRDSVRGLTTAASMWLTAAVGAAAGAGLMMLAAISTGAYFLSVMGLPPLARTVERWLDTGWPSLSVHYLDGRGVLRGVLAAVTASGFHVADMTTSRPPRGANGATDSHPAQAASVEVVVRLVGRGDLQSLMEQLSEMDGVLEVGVQDSSEPY